VREEGILLNTGKVIFSLTKLILFFTRTTCQPADQPTGWPINKPTSQPKKKTANQSIRLTNPTNRPVNYQAGQPINHRSTLLNTDRAKSQTGFNRSTPVHKSRRLHQNKK
jgi:hypothetical protein